MRARRSSANEVQRRTQQLCGKWWTGVASLCLPAMLCAALLAGCAKPAVRTVVIGVPVPSDEALEEIYGADFARCTPSVERWVAEVFRDQGWIEPGDWSEQ